MNEFTYRKRLTAAIVACVSVVIVCVGILSGGAYKQKTMRNSLESVQAQLEAAQAEELSLEERANILESQKNAAEDELSSIKVSTTAPVTETLVQTTASLTTASSTTASLTTAVIPPNKISPKPEPGNRKVYLTFDDGPSKNTPQILKILKKKKVKATFFVANHPSENHYMKDIVKSGNGIALHTFSHNYAEIYSSDKSLYEDVEKISDVVKKETGVTAKVYRFPGGSSNTVSKKYCGGVITRTAKGLTDKGYVYFDWNVNSGDADGKTFRLIKF